MAAAISALAVAQALLNDLRDVQTATLTDETDLDALASQMADAGAIVVTGDDQVTVAGQVDELQTVNLKGLWLEGRPLLLDNAAAAAAGSWMRAEPTPGSDLTYQPSDTFVWDYLSVEPGLNLIPGAVFEPRLLYDYLYGRLVSHIYHHPGIVLWDSTRYGDQHHADVGQGAW